MENIKIKANDDYELSLNIYHVENPKGYVQVIHGMQEHQMRYMPLALELNKVGYTVITSDIRGHGQNAKVLGFFSDNEGYKLVLDDQKLITNYIQTHFETEKVIILGHSMGTIITRNLLQTESKNYEKVILSGYPNYQSASNLGVLIGKIIKLFKGSKYNSKLLADLSVGSFNKQIKNTRTKQEDKISIEYIMYYLDEQLVDEDDEHCDCGCEHDDCNCDDDCDCGCSEAKECTCGDDCHCHSKE